MAAADTGSAPRGAMAPRLGAGSGTQGLASADETAARLDLSGGHIVRGSAPVSASCTSAQHRWPAAPVPAGRARPMSVAGRPVPALGSGPGAGLRVPPSPAGGPTSTAPLATCSRFFRAGLSASTCRRASTGWKCALRRHPCAGRAPSPRFSPRPSSRPSPVAASGTGPPVLWGRRERLRPSAPGPGPCW